MGVCIVCVSRRISQLLSMAASCSAPDLPVNLSESSDSRLSDSCYSDSRDSYYSGESNSSLRLFRPLSFPTEYEPTSPKSTDADNFTTATESEDGKLSVLNVSSDGSDEFWADHSETNNENGSSDPELCGDKWQCAKCQCINTPPDGCCQKCFAPRTEWFRHVPQKGKRKRRLSKKKRKRISDWNKNHISNVAGVDKRLCIVCKATTPKAAILHGKTAHKGCCFTCGQKLKTEQKPCPFCPRRIEKVVHIIGI